MNNEELCYDKESNNNHIIFKRKLFTLLRYLLFVPVSFILATIISGFVSIIQNYISFVMCKFALIIPYGICPANFHERTFLADLSFLYLIIYLSILIIPKFKKEIAIIELILIDLLYILLTMFFVFNHLFNTATLNTSIIGGLALTATILVINGKINITEL